MVLKQYKSGNNIYSIEHLTSKNAIQHSKDYLDYIELSTNTSFHELEREEHLTNLLEAIDNGECIRILVNGIEDCFVYAHQESRRVLNIKAIHCYDIEVIPKAKIILLNYLFTSGLNLRITPMDMWFLPNTSIVTTRSLRIFRNTDTTSIKCKRGFWDSKILSYLKVSKI